MVDFDVITHSPLTANTIADKKDSSITSAFQFYEHLKRLQWQFSAIYFIIKPQQNRHQPAPLRENSNHLGPRNADYRPQLSCRSGLAKTHMAQSIPFARPGLSPKDIHCTDRASSDTAPHL